MEGPHRILTDNEIVTVHHYCCHRCQPMSDAQLVNNEVCIGKTAGECRARFKDYQFYTNEPEPIFCEKFNFLRKF
jgi:hypothetical protein